MPEHEDSTPENETSETCTIDKRNLRRKYVRYLLIVTVLLVLNGVIGAGFYHSYQCTPLADTSTWTSYRINDCRIEARVSSELGEARTAEELLTSNTWQNINTVDIRTFSEISTGFAKDATQAYFEATPISAVDPNTFTPLTDLYSKDRDSVFWRSSKINNVDPNAFTPLNIIQGLAAHKNELYYHGSLITNSPNNTELSIESPTALQVILPNETVMLRWRAPLYFSHILLQLVDQDNVVTWVETYPLENSGSYVYTVPQDTEQSGTYSLRLIGISEKFGLAYLSEKENAVLIDNAKISLSANGSSDQDGVFVRLDEPIQLRWESRGVENCTLITPTKERSVSAEGGLIQTNAKELSDKPDILDLALKCKTDTGRVLIEHLSLVFFKNNAPDPIQLTMEYPTPNEALQYGQTTTIQWSGANFETAVDLLLFESNELETPSEGEAEPILIASNIPNSGAHSWTIPETINAATNYFIRVACHDPERLGLPQTNPHGNRFCNTSNTDGVFSIGLSEDEAIAERLRLKSEARLAREQSPTELTSINSFLYTDGIDTYYDSGFGVLTRKSAIDPNEIVLLNEYLFKTSSGVWYKDCGFDGSCLISYLAGADAETFKLLNDTYAKDKDSVFIILHPEEAPQNISILPLEEVQASSFTVLGYLFGADATNVYYADQPIEDADPETFAPYPLSMSYEKAIIFMDEDDTFIYQEADTENPLQSLRARPVATDLPEQDEESGNL
jgi:hypothetical protein